jgi:predicted type IV restriction endonuclease
MRKGDLGKFKAFEPSWSKPTVKMGQARYSHRVSLKTTTAVVVIAEDDADVSLTERAAA